MSFPYSTIENFESGTLGHFDTQTNAGMDFPHYTTLSRTPGLAMPYRGAYCARIDLALAGTDGAWVQEGAWDLTAGTNDLFLRLKFWLSKDAAMTSGDVFSLAELWSATNTAEACVGIKYTTAAGWEIGIGDAAVPSVLMPLTLGEWHDIEIQVAPQGGPTSTIDAWFDGTAMTQVGSLTIVNVTSGIIGANPGAAFTPTAGVLLIDQVIADIDGTRIGSGGKRFPKQVLMEKSGHLFVGSGILDNITLLSGNATDNVLQVWDTDRADTTNGTMKLELKNLTANEAVDPAGVPIEITKGCYISLTGTDPRAMANIHRAVGYYSDGAIRNHGNR